MLLSIIQIQQALNKAGHKVVVDGLMGPQTEEAISKLKGSWGFARRPYIGPITTSLLASYLVDMNALDPFYPPWMSEINKYMFMDERGSNSLLRKWLYSDRKTLGDPAQFPWCGDAVETAIKLTLPSEAFPGRLEANPYWAKNWILLGEETDIALGAVAVFVRPGGGHVGFVVGHDPRLGRIRVRGGNQNNQINDSWLDVERLLGYRKPTTWPHQLPVAPIMNSRGEVISDNEI